MGNFSARDAPLVCRVTHAELGWIGFEPKWTRDARRRCNENRSVERLRFDWYDSLYSASIFLRFFFSRESLIPSARRNEIQIYLTETEQIISRMVREVEPRLFGLLFSAVSDLSSSDRRWWSPSDYFLFRALHCPLAVIYTSAPRRRHGRISRVRIRAEIPSPLLADELFRKNFYAARVTSARHFPRSFLIALLLVFLTTPLFLPHPRNILRIAVLRRVILARFAKKSRDVFRQSTAASRFQMFINS